MLFIDHFCHICAVSVGTVFVLSPVYWKYEWLNHCSQGTHCLLVLNSVFPNMQFFTKCAVLSYRCAVASWTLCTCDFNYG